MNSVVVRKYGGSSLSTSEKIIGVAQDLKKLHDTGRKIIVIVSAMGSSTDDLIRLARSVAPKPAPRELDMLISTGERVSMSLMAMALQHLGCPAISFTGSQAGILTTPSHTDARIIDIKPVRVAHELQQGKVIVIAGFQGVCPETKEVTTLGRGGSDTSAVALAAHFQGECEALKDVPGVFSMDPKWGPGAVPIPQLSYEQLHHMTFWGAKVLHHRSVALAHKLKVPLKISLAHGQGSSTLITSESAMYEAPQILSLTSKENLLCVESPKPILSDVLKDIEAAAASHQIPSPDKLHFKKTNPGWQICLGVADVHINQMTSALKEAGIRVDSELWAALTWTGYDLMKSSLIQDVMNQCQNSQVEIFNLLTSSLGVTFFLPQSQLPKAIEIGAAYRL